MVVVVVVSVQVQPALRFLSLVQRPEVVVMALHLPVQLLMLTALPVVELVAPLALALVLVLALVLALVLVLVPALVLVLALVLVQSLSPRWTQQRGYARKDPTSTSCMQC